MIYYTPAEAAKIIGLPESWDAERWIRTRCKSGQIKGKQISRGVWRISDKALADFMEPAQEAATPTVVEPISFADALSPGARSRIRSA